MSDILIKGKKYCDDTCTFVLEDSTQCYYSQQSPYGTSQILEQACKVCVCCTLNHNLLEMIPSFYASFYTHLLGGFQHPLLPFQKIHYKNDTRVIENRKHEHSVRL